MSFGTKAFAAFLLAGSAAMLVLNVYSLATWEPLDFRIDDIKDLP